MFPSSLPSVASAPVVHQSPRNVTFHYRRSSAAYFGGMCSVSRGVGVNEVRRCPSSLCLHVSYSPRLVCQQCVCLFVCGVVVCCSTATAWPWRRPSPRAWPRTWASSGTRRQRKVLTKHTRCIFIQVVGSSENQPLVMSQRAQLSG